MPALSLSSPRSSAEPQVEQLAQLAVTCSSRFAQTPTILLARAIEDALQEEARVLQADACQLVEFTDQGAVAHIYTAGTGRPLAATLTPPAPWLLERLVRDQVVNVTRAEDLPFDAVEAREQARRTGRFGLLAIPGSSAGRVACALVIDTSWQPRRWSPALVDRVRLVSEIFAAAFRRPRHDALTPSVEAVTRLEGDNAYMKEELKSYHDFDEIVGDSDSLRTALTRLAQVAPTNSNVLLLGPTGTGKELFARAAHERSRRHARALVRVNCAALPPTLVESELFGHEKGAFTGAVCSRQGRFELADGGTIFLDEIGDLAPDVQVKFLRVLQEGEFERVGSSRTKRVDVRVIAATHRDLEVEVAEGRFRADLYYRLSVYPIRVPSLRDRIEDIPQLVWFFIHRHQRELGRRITTVPDALMDELKRHAWPGNVRELENVVERALIATTGEVLQLDDALPGGRTAPTAPVTDNLDELQRLHIEGVLERCDGRINGVGNAAERLGIHPNTLRFRMKKLGVDNSARARHFQPLTAH